jgi:NAD(P)-dependent dehydrogenase (short-subunit alcohol dehydrogenase family)
MIEIRGKVALITGGAKRIGRAIGLRLAREGAHVVFTYLRSASEAEATRREIEAMGVRAGAVQADLSRPETYDRLIDEARKAVGDIDVLINSASEFPRTGLDQLSADRAAFDRSFQSLTDLHVRAPLYLGMRLGLEMRKRGFGRIVNITDRVVARSQAYGGWPIYQVTKYALHGVTQVLAQALAPEVTVNAIAPGLVIPPDGFPADELAALLKKIPLGRAVGPEEIAEDVVHLVRSQSKTGSTLLSDGGSSMRTF